MYYAQHFNHWLLNTTLTVLTNIDELRLMGREVASDVTSCAIRNTCNATSNLCIVTKFCMCLKNKQVILTHYCVNKAIMYLKKACMSLLNVHKEFVIARC